MTVRYLSGRDKKKAECAVAEVFLNERLLDCHAKQPISPPWCNDSQCDPFIQSPSPLLLKHP